MKQSAAAWWPVGAWVIVILALTGFQLPRLVGASGSQLDKLVHFGMYFGLGWTLARAARISGLRTALAAAALIAAGIVFAGLDELLQRWVPRRAPDMADWLADVAGLVTAYALYAATWRRRWKSGAGRA
ncbi:MAG: VanZ family protein [Gemmatimonadota bacterium]|nr:VanZ family protein [Gemmatimonadota bacterium]